MNIIASPDVRELDEDEVTEELLEDVRNADFSNRD